MKKSQEAVEPLTFGEFFRQRRIELGFTLRSFCKTYQLDPGNVSRLERNILPPTINEEKLASYAMALKIPRDSQDWITFFDLAHTAKGRIPKDILNKEEAYKYLPLLFRTARGQKLSKKKLQELVKLINT
jgi:transcriptional regulator with XRE-family HTH domain